MNSITINSEDFKDENNEIKEEVNNWIKNVGVIYSADQSSAGGEHAQLFNDFKRRLIVFDVDYVENKSTFQEIDNFIKLVRDKLDPIDPTQYELLKKHYSQGPLIFASGPFASIMDKLENGSETYAIKQPEPDQIKKHLFLKDGEIYINVTAQAYPVFNMTQGGSNKANFYLPGADFLFKLGQDGFIFQKMTTDSAFIRDVYLNPDSITVDRLKEEPDIANIQKTCNEYLTRLKAIKNTEIEKKLKNSDDPKLNKSFNILLEKEDAINSLINTLQDDKNKDNKFGYFAEKFNEVKDIIKQHRGSFGIKFNIHKSEGEKFIEAIEARLAQQPNIQKNLPSFGLKS